MSHKILFMVILALMLTALANAADITGKWVMTTPRPNGAIHQTMIFKVGQEITSGPAKGDKPLTGTIETPFSPFDIFGEIDGDDVFFCSYQNYKPDGMSLHIWYGKIVSDNEIQFRQSFGSTGRDIGRGAGAPAFAGEQAQAEQGARGAAQAGPSVPNMDPEWAGKSNSFVSKFSAYRTTEENAVLPSARRGGPPPTGSGGAAPGGQAPPAQR